MTKKLIQADTVDAKGNVWKTTGENIRNGAKEFSKYDVISIIDILFPVGSIYCGENSLITSVGRWERVSLNGLPIISTSTIVSGNSTLSEYIAKQETALQGLSLRMWKRVS